NTFTATFPVQDAPLIRDGMRVYFLHRVVGHVRNPELGPAGVLVPMEINPSFVPAWKHMDPKLGLYRDRYHRSVTCIAPTPRVRPGRGLIQWGLAGPVSKSLGPN